MLAVSAAIAMSSMSLSSAPPEITSSSSRTHRPPKKSAQRFLRGSLRYTNSLNALLILAKRSHQIQNYRQRRHFLTFYNCLIGINKIANHIYPFRQRCSQSFFGWDRKRSCLASETKEARFFPICVCARPNSFTLLPLHFKRLSV